MYDAPKSWSTKFARTAFFRPDRPKSVLIQYSGDETVAAQFPHGNATTSTRNYVRTQPQVLRNIRLASGQTPQNIYQTLVIGGTNQQPSATPRNATQVRNTLNNHRQQSRPSRDALYNLHELAYDSEFIHHITTYPDLSVFLYHPELVEIFKETLSKDPQLLPTQQLSYDTTFNLGDFYLSILLFRATEFDPSPVIPLAYLIHERKLSSTHDDFFRHMKVICPEINSANNTVILTDNETSIRNAIKSNFPNVKSFLCWNHVLQVKL